MVQEVLETMYRRAAVLIAVVTCALAVAGCGGKHPSSSAPPDASATGTTPSAGTSATASPSGTVTAGPPAPPGGGGGGTDRCHTSSLKLGIQAAGGGAGQAYALLSLTNRSSVTCRVYGYPGMQLLGAGGKAVPTNLIPTGAKPTLITLAAGRTAWSRLHWSHVPGPGEQQAGLCEPEASSAQVTPPDETTRLSTTFAFGAVCEHGRIDATPMLASKPAA